MKTLDDIALLDLLPDSISGDEKVKAAAEAIDPQLKAIAEAVDLPLIYFRIDELTADQLEHLAVQYDVQAWRGEWPIETKRAVLKTAIQDKRLRGTRGAVQRAIETIAPIATITEWWQKNPKGTPHTFSINVVQDDGGAVDPQTQADVYGQVNSAKPVRSHFDFTVCQLAGAGIYASGFSRGLAYARVRSAGTTFEQGNIDAGILGAARAVTSRWLIENGHMGEMPEPTPTADLLTGIWAQWSGGDGSGFDGTDSSGNSHILQVISWSNPMEASSAGLIGSCFRSTGASRAYSSQIPPLQSNASWSISCWTKPSEISSNVRAIVQGSTSGNANGYIGIGLDNGHPCITKNSRTESFFTVSDVSVSVDDKWHHFVLSHHVETRLMILYLDGAKIAEWDSSSWAGTDHYASESAIGVGSTAYSSAPESVVGLIDEVSIWNGRAIGQDEVTALWNNGDGLPFDEWA